MKKQFDPITSPDWSGEADFHRKKTKPEAKPEPVLVPLEEQLVIHSSWYSWKGGKLTLEARAIGHVEFDGRVYEFDRVVKFRCQRETLEHERNILANKAGRRRAAR